MANPHDGYIAAVIGHCPNDEAEMIARCERLLPTVIDDSAYWQMLLAAWVANGNEMAPVGPRWLALFLSTRRNRLRAMKQAQRKVWHAMPRTVQLWRAGDPADPEVTPLSWTTSRLVAHHFGRVWRLPVVQRLAYRHEIAFYTDRRLEAEAIIIPGDPLTPSHLRPLQSAWYPDTAPPPSNAALQAHALRVALPGPRLRGG